MDIDGSSLDIHAEYPWIIFGYPWIIHGYPWIMDIHVSFMGSHGYILMLLLGGTTHMTNVMCMNKKSRSSPFARYRFIKVCTNSCVRNWSSVQFFRVVPDRLHMPLGVSTMLADAPGHFRFLMRVICDELPTRLVGWLPS